MPARRIALVGALALLVAGAAAQTAAAGSQAEARRALERARAIFAPDGRRADASLALRDLALAAKDLSPAGQRQARALTDRPGLGVSSRFHCVNVCVHWATAGRDAPPSRDANVNGLPDWVETTSAVLEEIWAKEIVQFGFRPPKSDLALPEHGPDGRLDVYLADIADEVLGYCSPELPPGYTGFDVPGHCVLDDDYSLAQLGPPTIGGRIELQLTAAHEFFHAVQFGYDAAEDGWLLEGTATWMEDEMYDALDEPHGRFPYSPLLHPEVPVDLYSTSEPYQYGSWVFWRFLQELLTAANTPRDPAVIRRVWELADAREGAPDLYSLQAVDAVARERQLDLRSVFTAFGITNAIPRSFYEQGATYPSAPAARSFTLSPAKRGTGAQRLVLDHMSNRHVSLRPAASASRQAQLVVTLDLPDFQRGSEATAIVLRRSGAPQIVRASLGLAGDATVRVAFGRGTVTRVVLVLTNASARYSCWRRTRLACAGAPLDDDQTFRFQARLVG